MSLRDTVGTEQAKEMYDLFMEYEAAETKEAKLVKDLDKLDMLVQAQQYRSPLLFLRDTYHNIDIFVCADMNKIGMSCWRSSSRARRTSCGTLRSSPLLMRFRGNAPLVARSNHNIE